MYTELDTSNSYLWLERFYLINLFLLPPKPKSKFPVSASNYSFTLSDSAYVTVTNNTLFFLDWQAFLSPLPFP